MTQIAVRPTWAADLDAIRRLGKLVLGKSPAVQTINRAVVLTGHFGYTALIGDEAIVGFMLGRVDAPRVIVTWIVAKQEFLETALSALVSKLRSEFPSFSFLFRIPHENYEFVASLRDITGDLTTPTEKADDPDYRWYEYAPPRPAPGDRRRNRQ